MMENARERERERERERAKEVERIVFLVWSVLDELLLPIPMQLLLYSDSSYCRFFFFFFLSLIDWLSLFSWCAYLLLTWFALSLSLSHPLFNARAIGSIFSEKSNCYTLNVSAHGFYNKSTFGHQLIQPYTEERCKLPSQELQGRKRERERERE